MKNANRNTLLAAAAALALAVAPSALADVRIHLNLPIPPPPHRVLRHLPVPPLPVLDVRYDARHRRDGRWNYGNPYRDDRYDRRYRNSRRWAYVEGRWILRPFRGAVWVDGHYDLHGRWIPGYWARARYLYR